MSSRSLVGVGVLWPGGCLVVGLAGLEAAVEDPDQPVAELAQGSMVADATCAQRVVVGPGTRRCLQGTEGLLVQGVGEPIVACVAGQHDLLLARCLGDWAGPGIVLAGPRTGVAVGIVAELAKHPGGEDIAQPWLAAVDLSVRVPAKIGAHLR